MKKHLNTLFVTTQGTYLSKEGETVVVKADGEIRLRVPVHTIGGIVCFGNVSCSPYLMGFCAENDVAISFLSEHGRFLAKVQGPVSGNVLLRREQYRKADDQKFSSEVTKFVLTGKITNCRTVLQRALRDHANKIEEHEVRNAVMRLNHLLEVFNQEQPLDVLRGIEGDAAHLSRVFDHLIRNACSYTLPEGRIEVFAAITNNCAKIYVTDDGIGISPHDLPHVFERMYRGRSADVGPTATRGLGLGLYLSRYIVEAHQGTISLDSKVNFGSVVIVELPVQQKQN